MGILRSLGIQAVILIMYLVLTRRGRIEPKQHALNFGIWFIKSCGGRILGALGPGLVNILGILFFVVMARLYWLFFERSRNTSIRNPDETCSLGVFMGSGGHTAEMKALVTTLDFDRYTPRTYVYCHGDEMSLRTITEIEATQPAASSSHLSVSLTHTISALPRARQVGESRLSTIVSASKTLIVALWYTFLVPLVKQWRDPWVDVLLINGPGTAVVLVAVAWIRRILGLRWTKIIYVESFARTNTLSLSGKLLRSFVDIFVVQWPQAAGPGSTVPFQERDAANGETDREPKVVHRGWLV